MDIVSLLASLLLQMSIYNFSVTAADGQKIDFNEFRNKKILIVNVATKSRYVDQAGSLERLYHKFKDSLVIIAFPCNDFNNEPLSDKEVSTFLISRYHISYWLASGISVTRENQAPIYKWLSLQDQNGVMDNNVPGDFTKFLIDSNGNIIGVFAGIIDPMSDDIQNAIAQ